MSNKIGSWVITCTHTGKGLETFSAATAERARAVKGLIVESIGDYLARINEEIKHGGHRA